MVETDFEKAQYRAAQEGKPLMVLVEEPGCKHCGRQAQFLSSNPGALEKVVAVKVSVEKPFSLPVTAKDLMRMRPAVYASLFITEHNYVAYVHANGRYHRNGSAQPSSWLDEIDRVVKNYKPSLEDPIWGREDLLLQRAEVVMQAAKEGAAALQEALKDQEDPCVVILGVQALKKWKPEDGTALWERLLLHHNFYVQKAALTQLLTFSDPGERVACSILQPVLYPHLLNNYVFGPRILREGPNEQIPQIHLDVALTLCTALADDPSLESAALVGQVFRVRSDEKSLEFIPNFYAKLAKTGSSKEVGVQIAKAMDLSGYYYRPYRDGLTGIDEIGENGRISAFENQFGKERDYLIGKLGPPVMRERMESLFKLLKKWKCPVKEPDWDSTEQVADALLAVRGWSEAELK